MLNQLEKFEKVIGYSFKDKKYGITALTHSSFANENKDKKVKIVNNERLEFLGDSVLSIVISELLFSKHKNLAEGQLTKIRARIVCEASLGRVARRLEFGKYMRFGRGEELTGGRERTSILSDAFEAVIAAIYLDGGIEPASDFIIQHMKDIIDESVKGQLFLDYKTKLQEVVQSDKTNKLKYIIVDEKGPDHNKVFYTEVLLNNDVIGLGKGRSKKESEQEAAKEGLKTLEKK